MRLARVEHGGERRTGVVRDDEITLLDLEFESDPSIPPIVKATTMDPDDLPESGTVPRSDVHLRPPIERPSKIVCMGLNYADHAEEAEIEIPDSPDVFAKAPTAVTATSRPIVYPHDVTRLDYEAEVAVVVGRGGRRIPPGDAYDYLAGVTAFNDVSARDVQFAGSQNFLGKSFDTFGPMGPTLRTLDGIDPDDLPFTARVNGELRQDSSTANMVFSIPEIVESVSRAMTLLPGDVISTGTPAGVGIHREDPQPFLLAPGDVVEIDVEEVGVLRNPVVAEQH